MPTLAPLAPGGQGSLPADGRLPTPRRFSFSTGQGKLLHGEGVLGFARGFFLAGVPRVVVSQWVVSDESSRALMHRFYEGLVTRDLPASAALRAAQRAQLEAGGPWAHPFHWAAFTLWGAAN